MDDRGPRRKAVAVGALCGVVGAVLTTLVFALLRLWVGVPSPAELIGDRLGERVPVRPFLDLLSAVGGYGRLKALSVVGVIFATLALGAALGAVDARVTERQRLEAGPSLDRLGLSRRALIGIGGDPGVLLRRVASMVRTGGPILVELGSSGATAPADRVRTMHGASTGPWFRWTAVGVESIHSLAVYVGLQVATRWSDDGRRFAQIDTPSRMRSRARPTSWESGVAPAGRWPGALEE